MCLLVTKIQSNDVKHLFSGNENCNVLGAYYKSPIKNSKVSYVMGVD